MLFNVSIKAQANASRKRVYIGHGLAAPFTETPDYYSKLTFNDSFWNLESGFVYGQLHMLNDSVIDNLGLRYNMTRDRFEARVDSSDGIYIVNDKAMKYVVMMDEKFANYQYLNPDSTKLKGYFKIIGGNKTLLLFKKMEIHKEGKTGAYGHDAYKAYKNRYFLKIPGQTYPVEVKLRKKDILKALNFKGPKLEMFAKENHLHFSNEYELTGILTYYDKLVSEKK